MLFLKNWKLLLNVRLGNCSTPRVTIFCRFTGFTFYKDAIDLTTRQFLKVHFRYNFFQNEVRKTNLEHFELLRPWGPQSQFPGGPRFARHYLEHTQHSNPQGPRLAWTY